MKAMVLPEKQLLYVLKKQGFKPIGKKDFIKKKSGTDIFFVKEMLEFCGKTINIEMTENDFIFNFWDFKCGERYYWNKNWFVPNTVRFVI